uniref:Putative secreted protein n=1 Tax=Ixodes ricinus TaxID=34613 RepID=A0A6B0UCE8_IXORI
MIRLKGRRTFNCLLVFLLCGAKAVLVGVPFKCSVTVYDLLTVFFVECWSGQCTWLLLPARSCGGRQQLCRLEIRVPVATHAIALQCCSSTLF